MYSFLINAVLFLKNDFQNNGFIGGQVSLFFNLDVLPKSQQIMIWIKKGKFPLPPRFGLQMSIWMDWDFFVQKGLIKSIDIVSPDVNLSIIFFRIESLEFKKVDLNPVFFDHQVAIIIRISRFLKT